MLQKATSLRKSVPRPPNICYEHVSCNIVLRLPRKNASFQILFQCPLQKLHVLLTFDNVQNPLHLPHQTTSERPKVVPAWCVCAFWLGNVLHAKTACTFSTSQFPKVVRSWCVLYILTWKCAWCHSSVHFFDISTSESDPALMCPNMWCF